MHMFSVRLLGGAAVTRGPEFNTKRVALDRDLCTCQSLLDPPANTVHKYTTIIILYTSEIMCIMARMNLNDVMCRKAGDRDWHPAT